MSEWQPIETAPRDGASVLLAYPNLKHPVIGWYFEREERSFGKVVRTSEGWSTGLMWMTIEDQPEPTHWMPLPEHPDANSEKERAF